MALCDLEGVKDKSVEVGDVADFILARERALIERVEKPLRELQEKHNGNAVRANFTYCGCDSCEKIDEALAIIEKEGGE